MRTLTLDEVGFVSGGDGDDEPMQEVVVQGKRIIDWPLRYYLSEDTGGGRFAGDGGGGEVLEEVVVESPKMTEQEKFAYDLAKARAEAALTMMEFTGATAVAKLGGISAVAAAWVAYTTERVYTAEDREKLLEIMTENEFRFDGMDGKYDGETVKDRDYR